MESKDTSGAKKTKLKKSRVTLLYRFFTVVQQPV